MTVALITLMAAALRFATLDVQSVWLDEAATIRLVGRGVGGMLSQLPAHESTPPLYYLLVWAWTHTFGHGVIAFRSFSALVGTLTVPLLYVAGSRFSTAAGLWAAGLGAISAEMFYYSQEARAYGLFVLLSLAAFVAWQRALQAPRRRTLALWSALSILALLTHYFGVFMFVGELAVLLRRLGWRRLAAPTGAYTLAVAALAPLAVEQARSGVSSWIAQSSLAGRLEEAPKEFLIGMYGPWGLVLAPAAALLVAVALVRLARDSDPRRRRASLDVATVGVVAIGIPALLAITRTEDVFKARNLLGAWPVLFVLVAAGMATSTVRLRALLGIGFCAISLAVIVGTLALPAYQRDDWRGAARSLPVPAPDGRILVSEPYGSAPLSVYLRDVSDFRPGDRTVATHELDFVFLRRARRGAFAPGENSLSAPLPPGSPAVDPPAPFRLTTVRRTAAYATYRFLALTATRVTISQLRRAFGDPNADIAVQG